MMPMLNQKCCPLVAGGWILKPLGISTNGYSRVTANQSEDFNTLIKQLTRFTGTGCVLPHSATTGMRCREASLCSGNTPPSESISRSGKFQSLAISTEEMKLESCYPPVETVEMLCHVRMGMGSDKIKETMRKVTLRKH